MKAFVRWVDRAPLWLFALLVATLGLAPWIPEPHVAEKLRWLLAGELNRLWDILDLVMHAIPWLLMAFKLYRTSVTARGRP
ncbi:MULTISPECIES: hypothetical protein [unclassified Thioalkalivibrio]|uniref:hypothetical protein n=1 Tax=unclassified Thioalkalivibrio TaxID=2621013 RepID=UPI00036C2B27|nr:MULTISPECIES: hypothetical protein [unclassified Thioalkalivibrio]